MRKLQDLVILRSAIEDTLLQTLPPSEVKKLQTLRATLSSVQDLSGTKVQLKPGMNSEGGLESLQVILKWGGGQSSLNYAMLVPDWLPQNSPTYATPAFTFRHSDIRKAGRHQMIELAQTFRDDYLVMNKDLLNDCQVRALAARLVSPLNPTNLSGLLEL